MGIDPTYHKLLELIAFAIPIAVLLTLFSLWRSARRHRRGDLPSPPEVGREPFHAVPQVRPVVEPPLSEPVAHETPEAITAKIEAAVANGEKSRLASLYVELAEAHARDGNSSARMAALRSAAGYGALHGPHAAHAAARLALGDAARQSGDLTTACEQWQLARTAFLESGDTVQHARVDKCMRDNGCPTDWVLTDF
ncbi:MAG: hypothetical protein QM780_06385 [Hyphomicrobium sp.]|uniref:hypothetical protein n=1 Tax=Hyphomicrobium sp. TaxID=82 RepID=UPI0039E241A6